jgi:hypothetical protein
MKILCVFILSLPGLLLAQAAQPSSAKARNNSLIQPARVESDYRSPQSASESKNETGSAFDSHQKQPESWLNEYTARRNSFTISEGYISEAENKNLNNLVNEAKKSIPESFEFQYIQLRQNRNTAESAELIKQAVKAGGLAHPLLLPEMAWLAERNSDKIARNKSIEAYAAAGQISKAQASMAEMSAQIAGNNALIITNGEFDTYPLWLKAPNTKVISLAMLEDRVWLMRCLNEWDPSLNVSSIKDANTLLRTLRDKARFPVFVSLSLRPDLLTRYSASLFPIGPLARLNDTSIDLSSQLIAFYLNPSFEKEIVKISATDSYAKATANLLPGLVILYRLEQKLSADQRIKVKALIALVSNISGKKIAYE